MFTCLLEWTKDRGSREASANMPIVYCLLTKCWSWPRVEGEEVFGKGENLSVESNKPKCNQKLSAEQVDVFQISCI